MGKTAPPAPNYQGAAQSQAASSQANVNQQTQANRANQNNAVGGTSQWTQGPNGQWTQSSGFNGPLSGASSELQGQAANNFAQPLDNGSQARQEAIQNIYGSEMAQLNPQFQQQNASQAAQLANEGIDPSSEAGRNAANNTAFQQQQEQLGALGNAEQQGTEAQQATFGENLQAREAPLSELGALQGLSGQAGYNQAGQAQAEQDLPAAMALGNYQLPAWQAQNQAQGDIFGGAMQFLNGFMPQMAKGGVATGPAIVGEEGPEVVVPEGPAAVVPLPGGRRTLLPGGKLKPFSFGGKRRG